MVKLRSHNNGPGQTQSQINDISIFLGIDNINLPEKKTIEFKGVERQRQQEKKKEKTNKKKKGKK